MNTRFHDKIRRLGVLLAIATAFTALVAAPALGQDRPASSYYKPQVLQRMSDSWAARGGVLTNVPASSYYLPQQIETMSQGWAARGGLLPASANGDHGVATASTGATSGSAPRRCSASFSSEAVSSPARTTSGGM